MSALKRHQSLDLVDSDEEELSEREEETLEEILVLFPAREIKEETEFIEDDTFEKVKNLLTCPICLEIFNEPVFVKKCLHRFCKTCIERVIRSQINKSCPSCRVALGCKRILKNDIVTEEIIQNVFPNLKEYQKKEEEHQKLYYRSKTKEIQDNHNPLKRRRRELSPLRRTCSTPVPKEAEPEVKKKEPEIKKAPEEKEKKPKKLKAKQKKKKNFKKSDADITILDIDPDRVIEIIEDNDDESDGIIILEDEPEEFIQKKKKTNSEQEVILIDESTDCEEVKDDKKLARDLFTSKIPVMPKKADPLSLLLENKDIQQYQALANMALQLEMLSPLMMPNLLPEPALRPYDPLMAGAIAPLGLNMLPMIGMDKAVGMVPDQSFLKEIDINKLFPKKTFDKEVNLKELFNWTHPLALFGQPMDPFGLMNPSLLQLMQANKSVKDDKIL